MTEPFDLSELTTDIVAAYVSNNTVALCEIAGLIEVVGAALRQASGGAAIEAAPEPPKPAVSVRKSITPDHLISLEDGRPYRTLKRHLSGRGLTPDEYRRKWSLPDDYPMIAPSYAAMRSQLATKNGLGYSRQKAAGLKTAQPAKAPAKRGRKPKTAEA